MNRSILKQSLLVFGTIALGMATRKLGFLFPDFIAVYGGDALWALMVYWGFGLLFPKKSPWTIFMMATGFSFFIEFSQLYQADWINALRRNPFGALVLGNTFVWTDLLCYSAGTILGFGIESFTRRLSEDQ